MKFTVHPPTSSPSDSRSRSGRGVATIFFGLFFVVGALFTVLILGETWKQLGPWWWPETDCTVLSSSVVDTGDDQNPYRAEVRYRYEIDGQIHESDRFFSNDGDTASFDRARDRAARYQPDAAVICRVSPDNPALAVLERRIPWIAFTALFPLIFVAIGGVGLYATWRGTRQGKEAAIESISQTAASKTGHKAVVLFGLLFAIVGGAVFVPMTALPAVRFMASMGWEAVPCTVLSSRLRSWSTDDGTSYRADVLYIYRAGGRDWTSNRVDFFGFFSSGSDSARAILDRHPDGTADVCWVNPRDPSRSVLERRLRPMHLLGLLPMVFVIVGGALARYGWTRLRARQIENEARIEEAAPAAEPLVLKPQVGPVGKVFGTLLFALLWNGIVSIFLWQVWQGWEQGRPDWFFTLFMIPFVLVGLLLFGLVGYSLLALANPRPRLTLAPGRPRLGDGLRLEWRFTGRAGRLEHLHIFLEGREEATYQRGTKTHTDREVFATLDLIDTANAWEIPRGTAELVIPAETMHSFGGDSNKILWEIKVEGKITRWPDVDQNFPVDIRPMRVEDL